MTQQVAMEVLELFYQQSGPSLLDHVNNSEVLEAATVQLIQSKLSAVHVVSITLCFYITSSLIGIQTFRICLWRFGCFNIWLVIIYIYIYISMFIDWFICVCVHCSALSAGVCFPMILKKIWCTITSLRIKPLQGDLIWSTPCPNPWTNPNESANHLNHYPRALAPSRRKPGRITRPDPEPNTNPRMSRTRTSRIPSQFPLLFRHLQPFKSLFPVGLSTHTTMRVTCWASTSLLLRCARSLSLSLSLPLYFYISLYVYMWLSISPNR